MANREPENGNSTYSRMVELYEAGDLPWDSAEPPPEVVDYLDRTRPGKALDLGCGYGRASIYMAKLGWKVDAIDFIPAALDEASRRADQTDVEIRFHMSEVTNLDFLSGPYDFGLDVGCCHNLSREELQIYRNQLKRLIKPGGTFLLFARVRDEDSVEEGEALAAYAIHEFSNLFQDGFEMEWLEEGFTDAGDHGAWKSAWFSFRRLSADVIQ